MRLLIFACGWFFGLWLAAMVQLSALQWSAIALCGMVFSIAVRRYRKVAVSFFCVGVMAMAGARYVTAIPQINEHHVAFYNDKLTVLIKGTVSAEPDVRDRFVNLRLDVSAVELADGELIPVEGTLLALVPRYPEWAYGDVLRLNGRLETPPDDGEFNYRAYLAQQGVHSLIAFPEIEQLNQRQGNRIRHAVLDVKARAQTSLNRVVPEPQSALLSGILLGNDQGLSDGLEEAFRLTGMTHIIAISGFNIAILILILSAIAKPFLPWPGTAVFAIVGITLYTVLVGADASVVRAALMGTVFLFTRGWLGRPVYTVAALCLTGVAMTAVNPLWLWDVGFQLSFAATLSLILYTDPLTDWVMARLKLWIDRELIEKMAGFLTEAVFITIAAQLLTLPLMMGHFGQLSLISLVANALILPAQPGVMLWGGLATLIGMISPVLGQIVGWIAWLFLSYTITLVELLAAVPFAAVAVELPWSGVVVIYLLIALLTWVAKQPTKAKRRLLQQVRGSVSQTAVLGATAVFALLTVNWGMSQPDGRLHIIFFNVGQGDATLIVTPSGRQVLIDGGQVPTQLNDQLGDHLPFYDRHLDIVVATHPDADHVTGLVGVFERYRVDWLITDGSEVGETAVYDAVLEAATDSGATVKAAVVGEQIDMGDGIVLQMLHPGERRDADNRNENSVAMRLTYGDFAYLFTGDGEIMAERAMLQSGLELTAVVFKAGHHGSRTSSSLNFLQAVQPRYLIVSAGADNRFGHPHPEVLERAEQMGTAVLRTDQLGTIKLTTDGQQLWWLAYP